VQKIFFHKVKIDNNQVQTEVLSKKNTFFIN
jgi:hypothetical protein